ncbi:HalOD1 output domain-containing protein [Halorubrum sp. N11]|uniref:HalOD1 output domain-containing protein n=1 Tax=Halorubrum sp. N11 TaxID=3402276 RepID=UPI003EBADBE4
MARTSNGANQSQTGKGELLESASSWDLTDIAFIDESKQHGDFYRVKYDSGQTTPSFAVLTIISKVTEIDLLDLNPLYDSIDGDALDALCTADLSSVSRLTFQYHGCKITIGTDDVVEVIVG